MSTHFCPNRVCSSLKNGLRDRQSTALTRAAVALLTLAAMSATGPMRATAGEVSVVGHIDVHVHGINDASFDATTVSAEIREGAFGEWGAGTLIQITPPAGFAFNPASMVTGDVTVGDIDIGGGAGVDFAVAPTASMIQFQVNNASTAASTIRFLNIQLRATVCGVAILGAANPIKVNVVGSTPTNADLVTVAVVNDITDLHHFDLVAVPSTQAAGANILVTLTARDFCGNAITGGFVIPVGTPIVVTATGGAGTRTYSNGSVAVTPTVANTAEIQNPEMLDANAQGTFNVTSPIGEDPDITISATLGAASGSTIVHWFTASCALSPTGVLRAVNSLHAVTATVLQNGATPVQNTDVNFSVTAGPNVGINGIATTNALGQATFLYTGGALTGVDTIQASGAIGAVNFMCTDANAVEWVSPACNIAPALPPTAAGGMQTVLVDVERRPGFDVPDGTMITLTVIGGPNTLFTDTQPTAAGIATFMYTDLGGPGLDTLRATGTLAGASFECLTTKEWIQPTCELTPLTSVNGINTIHNFTVTLLRRPGVPAAGVPISPSIAGPNAFATILPAAPMTDAMGQVTLSYTGTLAGTDTITTSATVGGILTSCMATKEWIDSGCGLNLTSPLNLTSQIGTTQTLTVTVLRTTGMPAINAIVNFAVTGVNPTVGAAVTDVNGNASFTYTGNNVGTDTITATSTVDGVPILCMTNKDWINLSCSLDPPTDTNAIGSMHSVEVTLLQNGAPLDGVSLTFAVTAGPNTGVPGLVSGNTGSTGSGQTTFTYTGGGNTGTDTIRCFGTISGVLVECFATKTWVAQPSCTIAPMASSLVGGMQTVSVDVDQAPGFNAADGTIVNVQVIAGPNVLTGGAVPTAGGTANFMYTSNGVPGVDSIRASGIIGGVPFECLTTKEWIQPSCTLTPPADINRINTIHNLVFTLFRRPGVAAAGVPVTASIAGPNSFATILPAAPMTDATGQVTLSYTGTVVGLDTITVSGTVDGVLTSCMATKEWINSGCMLTPMLDTNLVGTQHTVTATVLRTTPPDVPAANAIVNFSITGGPNMGQVGVGVTNVNGITSFTYTSNGMPGTDTITANTIVDGIPIPACANVAMKTWINLSCNVTPADATNLVGTAHTATVTLVTNNAADANNAPVSFMITSGPNAGTALATQTGPLNGFPAGQAQFPYTSNGSFGTDIIRASGLVLGVPFECQTTKTWVNPQCSLTPATKTNPTGTLHTLTGTVTRNGAPAAGINVVFTITGGPNNGLVHNAVTDGAGQAVFSYTGAGGVGTDTIELTGVLDGIPFLCSATKTWQAPDNNGIPPDVENNAPNNGDGNNDGIPDSLQPNVASFPDINGDYVTIVSPAGTTLTNVKASGVPAGGIIPPDVVFPAGFFGFHVEGVAPGGEVAVTMILHSNPTVNTFYKFGPTPIIPVDHYYSFIFDGTTGSEIAGNVITLHFVDGQRGDHDLAANGVIVEPGAPALQADNPAPITPSASCGLCGAANAVTMPLMVFGLLCMRRGRSRRGR